MIQAHCQRLCFEAFLIMAMAVEILTWSDALLLASLQITATSVNIGGLCQTLLQGNVHAILIEKEDIELVHAFTSNLGCQQHKQCSCCVDPVMQYIAEPEGANMFGCILMSILCKKDHRCPGKLVVSGAQVLDLAEPMHATQQHHKLLVHHVVAIQQKPLHTSLVLRVLWPCHQKHQRSNLCVGNRGVAQLDLIAGNAWEPRPGSNAP
jgi:hypothetical protein